MYNEMLAFPEEGIISRGKNAVQLAVTDSESEDEAVNPGNNVQFQDRTALMSTNIGGNHIIAESVGDADDENLFMEKLRSGDYLELNVAEKLKILRFLIDEVLQTHSFWCLS